MAYAPIAYTSDTRVKKILRTSNNKITIGSGDGEITQADLDDYIIEASEFIDGFIRAVVGFDSLPITTFVQKPEITFAAPRIAAYLLFRDLYASYRTEDLGAGVRGWLAEAEDSLDRLKNHVDLGVYTDLSPATGGIQFITSEQFFQTQIGVRGVRDQKADQKNIEPLKLGNISPYQDGNIDTI